VGRTLGASNGELLTGSVIGGAMFEEYTGSGSGLGEENDFDR
jgi:hypothetical protein